MVVTRGWHRWTVAIVASASIATISRISLSWCAHWELEDESTCSLEICNAVILHRRKVSWYGERLVGLRIRVGADGELGWRSVDKEDADKRGTDIAILFSL